MASKNFAINTDPHDATIGDKTLFFVPEVEGSEFMTAYTELRDVQKIVGQNEVDATAEDLVMVNTAMRDFLSGLMLPDSRVTFDTMKLPSRVLVQMLEWVAGIYGGGSGNDRTTSSSGA